MTKLKKFKTKHFGKRNKFDVNGSYTGTGLINDIPVQDVDDL